MADSQCRLIARMAPFGVTEVVSACLVAGGFDRVARLETAVSDNGDAKELLVLVGSGTAAEGVIQADLENMAAALLNFVDSVRNEAKGLRRRSTAVFQSE